MSIKILIVEDSIVSGILLTETIHRKKPECQVRLRKSLKGALEEIETFKPDVIVLDLGLTDAHPEEVVKSITKLKKFGAKILVASAYEDMHDLALQSGANDFMQKAIGDDPNNFINRITTLADEKTLSN